MLNLNRGRRFMAKEVNNTFNDVWDLLYEQADPVSSKSVTISMVRYNFGAMNTFFSSLSRILPNG